VKLYIMRKLVKVVLTGGLGNQLFQYFAGLHVAHRNNAALRVDSTFSQRGRSGHNDWIDVLELPGEISSDAPRYSIRFFTSYVHKLFREAMKRLIRTQVLQVKLLREYTSPELGYDPALDALQPTITITGYFQTWRYYQSLKDAGQAPELKIPKYSDWYLEMLAVLESHGRVLGLHIRRGDYVGHPTIGVLSNSYYERAILALKNRNLDWDAVWIFSDNPVAAKVELAKVFSSYSRVHFVEPTPESHSFESLSLMSKTSALVIANSTFSWWAAALGDRSKPIVCPDKWFLAMEDPSDLCPPSWIRVSSSWT